MSAYIVSPEHIDYLLTASALFSDDPFLSEVWSLTGQALLDENVKSVQYRYDDVAFADLPGPVDQSRILHYTFVPTIVTITPVRVLKAISGYAYQACEHEGWEESAAKAFCEQLTQMAESRLPDGLRGLNRRPYGGTVMAYQVSDEWNEADTWEVTSETVERHRKIALGEV